VRGWRPSSAKFFVAGSIVSAEVFLVAFDILRASGMRDLTTTCARCPVERFAAAKCTVHLANNLKETIYLTGRLEQQYKLLENLVPGRKYYIGGLVNDSWVSNSFRDASTAQKQNARSVVICDALSGSRSLGSIVNHLQ